MPGIVGIVGPGRAEERSAELRAMLASLHHETFYAHGFVECPELEVWAGWSAHRGSLAERLSTCTLPTGARLVLAGEFFPAATRPASETGAILESVLDDWRSRGDEALAALNGLFSGLIIDPPTRRVALFNDRYGIERLYMHRRGETLYFSSEAKAILAVCPRCRAFDERSVAAYLKFGSVPGPATLFRDIELLSGAAVVSRSPGDALPRERRYFEPSEWEALPALPADAFVEELAETLRARVPLYAAMDGSDVGIAVTGGLDTRMILAALPPQTAGATCYTFGGIDGETLDQRLGRRSAAARGLEHQTLRVSPNFLSQFETFVDRTVAVSDATAGATSAHEIYLTALARAIAPIRLTGNYGSEVLRGMSTVKPRETAAEILEPSVGELMRQSTYGRRHAHPVTASAFAEVPWHLYGPLAVGRSQLGFRTPYLDNAIVALAYRAPAASRADGTASFRVVARLTPELASIPTDRGLVHGAGPLRSISQRAYAAATFKLDYLDKEGLPGWMRPAAPVLALLRGTRLLGGHKYLPYRSWFRTELRDYLSAVATGPRVRQLGFWNAPALVRLVERHVSGRQNALHEINCMLTLEAAGRLLLAADVHRGGGRPIAGALNK